MNLLLVLVLVLSGLPFQPLKDLFDRLTFKYFKRNKYEVRYAFFELSTFLAQVADQRELVQGTMKILNKYLVAEQAWLVIAHEDRSTVYEADMSEGALAVLEGGRAAEIGKRVRGLREDHELELILPLGIRGETVAYLALGPKSSGAKYTDRDREFLSLSSRNLAIAIRKSENLVLLKERRVMLQGKVRRATEQLEVTNEQLKELDAGKDEFMRLASHNLRTPLTAIHNYAEMFVDGRFGKLEPTEQKMYERISSSVKRMVRLIDDLMNASSITTAEMLVDNSEPFDLSILARDLVDDFEGAFASKRITLSRKMRTTPLPVFADHHKIKEVISNLLENSIQYSPEDTAVKVTLVKRGDQALFRVEDQGIGIPPRQQQALFNKFYRAENAKKMRPGGTGLGLYMAKKIVAAHGGGMVFSSTLGKGSTFGFWLPLTK